MRRLYDAQGSAAWHALPQPAGDDSHVAAALPAAMAAVAARRRRAHAHGGGAGGDAGGGFVRAPEICWKRESEAQDVRPATMNTADTLLRSFSAPWRWPTMGTDTCGGTPVRALSSPRRRPSGHCAQVRPPDRGRRPAEVQRRHGPGHFERAGEDAAAGDSATAAQGPQPKRWRAVSLGQLCDRLFGDLGAAQALNTVDTSEWRKIAGFSYTVKMLPSDRAKVQTAAPHRRDDQSCLIHLHVISLVAQQLAAGR